MRCVDADKLYPDCMTKDGKLAISQSQLANAPTVEYTFEEAFQKSECGAEIEVEDCSDDKFCFNCGSDMRKGGTK